MRIRLHELAEEIAAEQVEYCKAVKLTPYGAIKVFGLDLARQPGTKDWDAVHDAFARCWLAMRRQRLMKPYMGIFMDEAA